MGGFNCIRAGDISPKNYRLVASAQHNMMQDPEKLREFSRTCKKLGIRLDFIDITDPNFEFRAVRMFLWTKECTIIEYAHNYYAENLYPYMCTAFDSRSDSAYFHPVSGICAANHFFNQFWIWQRKPNAF